MTHHAPMADALPLLLRHATTADRPFVRERFHEAAERTYPGLATLGRLSRKERMDALFEREWEAGVSLVASVGDRKLGMAMAAPHHHPVTDAFEWVLGSIAVLPEAQGQGVGKALVAELVRLAQEAGAGELRLFVAANNPSALALYRQAGFESTTLEMVLPLRP